MVFRWFSRALLALLVADSAAAFEVYNSAADDGVDSGVLVLEVGVPTTVNLYFDPTAEGGIFAAGITIDAAGASIDSFAPEAGVEFNLASPTRLALLPFSFADPFGVITRLGSAQVTASQEGALLTADGVAVDSTPLEQAFPIQTIGQSATATPTLGRTALSLFALALGAALFSLVRYTRTQRRVSRTLPD